MPRRQIPGTAPLSLDISIEAKLRFVTLHQSLGFKTKSDTLEAILYAVSTKERIDSHALERIERKIDRAVQCLDELL